MRKYFEFTGTINGSTYFLRNLLATIFAFFVGYGIGYNFASNNVPMGMLFVIAFVPLMWFQLTTIYKRMSALFPSEATVYTAVLIAIQVFSTMISVDSPIKSLVTLVLLVIGCILIFKNSGIDNHEG